VPISAAERRFVLDQLVTQSQSTMIRLWDAAGRFDDVDFFRYVSETFPDIAIGYHQLAAEYAASWFEFDFPDMPGTAAVAAAPAVDRFTTSAQWALGADGRQALTRLGGTLQRAIYDGDRATTVQNARSNGMRWIRVARPNACAFCRLLATRSDIDETYRSAVFNEETGEYETQVVGRSVNLSIADRRMIASGQMTREEALARRDEMQLVYQIGRRKGSPRGRRPRGTRRLGDKYHDDCKCTAKAIPAGVDAFEVLVAEEPEYAVQVEQWTNEYIKARNNSDSGDPKRILAEWRTFGDDIA